MIPFKAASLTAESIDLKTWLSDRVRQTNWLAAGIAAALQGGVLSMLIMMGVVSTSESKREKPLVTTISAAPQQPSVPAPPRPQQKDEPVAQPKAEAIVPPAKIQISAAPPVAAAAERTPDPPAPAPPAPAAAAAPAAPAATAASSGPVKVANLAAILIYGPPPPYPAVSKHKKETGTVVVWVLISEEGRVIEVSVQRSTGFAALDQAALRAVRTYRFSPTMRDGRAVRVSGAIAMPFKLKTS